MSDTITVNTSTTNITLSVFSTPNNINVSVVEPGAIWGAINGSITNQTDLVNYINNSGGGAGVDTGVRALTSNWQSTYATVCALSANWNTSYQSTTALNLSSVYWNNVYTAVKNLSTSFGGLTSIDTGVRALTSNWQSTYVTVCALSANWNTAYNISTAYQNTSSSFATNSTVNTLTGLLVKTVDLNTLSATLLTRTDANTLTSLLVTNTAFNSYQTNVASTTATLLPTSVYQNASGSFATNTLLQSTSALLTPLTLTNSLTSQLVLNTDFNNYKTSVAASTATLLPTSVYQSTSGNFITAVSGTANQINASKSGSTVTLSLPQSAVFPGDVNIIGNLTIAGSATYINTKNLVVGDNIIYFNDNNYGSNVLDVGIVSHFTQAPLGYNHTGLVRRAGGGIPGVWTLFSGLTTEPISATNLDWNDKNIVIDSLSANLIGNVTGNADTVTNGVYTNGSYSNPSWITSLADTKITGPNRNNWDNVYSLINTTTATTFNVNNLTTTGKTGIKQTPVYFDVDTNNIGNSYGTLGIGSSQDVNIYPNNNLLLSPIGNVGVNTNTPNQKLTVSGNISSNNVIYDATGNSVNWNSAYNTSTAYQNASGSFATNTLLQSTSALLTPLTLTNTLTSQLVLNTTLNSLSGNWQSTYGTVSSLSANWNSAYTSLLNYLPLSGGTLTGGLSAPALSSSYLFGTGNETVLSDGLGTNDLGNGNNTLSLNFSGGVFVGGNGVLITPTAIVTSLTATNTTTNTLTATNIKSTIITGNGVPVYSYLTNDGGAVGPGPTNGTTFGLAAFSLVAGGVYELFYDTWFLKTTTGNMFYVLSSNTSFANVAVEAVQSTTNNTAFNAPTKALNFGQTAPVVQLPSTTPIALTNAVNYNTSIRYCIQANIFTGNTVVLTLSTSAGTFTPRAYSYGKLTRIA